MAIPNWNRFTKKELLARLNWRCKHGQNGISHRCCWDRDHNNVERVAFLDIECSNLKADYGIMLSYCIKPAGSKQILSSVITKKDLQSGVLDKRIVTNCIEDMRKFDKMVGHYSSRFDIPFVRTRALYWDLDFPQYRELTQVDTWRLAKRLLCLSSNRQNVIAQTILHQDIKTRIVPEVWINALQGNPKALAYILDHNRRDVLQLERNYNKLIKFAARCNQTI